MPVTRARENISNRITPKSKFTWDYVLVLWTRTGRIDGRTTPLRNTAPSYRDGRIISCVIIAYYGLNERSVCRQRHRDVVIDYCNVIGNGFIMLHSVLGMTYDDEWITLTTWQQPGSNLHPPPIGGDTPLLTLTHTPTCPWRHPKTEILKIYWQQLRRYSCNGNLRSAGLSVYGETKIKPNVVWKSVLT